MADVAVHGLKLRSLPTQDNHCDCGLFVLCAVLFFCHANPKVLDYSVLLALNGANVKGEAGGGRETSSRLRQEVPAAEDEAQGPCAMHC